MKKVVSLILFMVLLCFGIAVASGSNEEYTLEPGMYEVGKDIPSGYYSGGKISTSSAYSQGRTDGYNDGYEKGKNDPTALKNARDAGYAAGCASKSGSFRFRTSYGGNNRVYAKIYINGEFIDEIHDSDGHCDYTFTY